MYTLNIGLNNNPFSFTESVIVLSRFGVKDFEFRIGVFTYPDGSTEQEPTLVIKFARKPNVAKLCKLFTQICIPVFDHSTGEGKLVYNPSFTGDRFEFDSQYFFEIRGWSDPIPAESIEVN